MAFTHSKIVRSIPVHGNNSVHGKMASESVNKIGLNEVKSNQKL